MNYHKEYSDYIIESCGISDIDLVGEFLNAYWSEGHILYVDKNYRDWQYHNKRRMNYNFLLAREKQAGDIHGIIGYIPTYLYDNNITDDDKFIWLTSWMIHPDARAGSNIGMRLLAAVPVYEQTDNIGTVGNYDSVAPLYKMLKFDTGLLDHYYILSDNIKDYQIAKLPAKHKSTDECSKPERFVAGHAPHNYHNSSIKVITRSDFENIYDEVMKNGRQALPYKSKSYFINRYYNHPVYSYEALAIQTDGDIDSVFIFRTVRHGGGCALRIIDGFGDFSKMQSLRDDARQLLDERKSEYIDIYCKGINADILINAGFTPHRADSEIIIPNFFEPFERKNRNVNYACLNPLGKEYTFFKGDGDQDRPNMLGVRD